MNTKNILFITQTHSDGGGAEKILTTLVNALNPDKYNITIQEIHNRNVKKEPLNQNIKFLKPFIDVQNESRFDQNFKRFCIEKYPELIRAIYQWYNYDVIITWNDVYPSYFLPAFDDKNTIGWCHGTMDISNKNSKYLGKQFFFNAQKKSWKYADKIVVISDAMKKHTINIFPEYEEKTQVNYNPFNIEECKEKSLETITDFDFENYNFPFLICMGRLDKNKNIKLIIEAVINLHDENISCGLLIIGQGDQKNELQKLADKSKLKNQIFFLGYKQNPLPYLLKSKILCLSSFTEGFPTVILEAMALGKPFISTPVSGARDELSANNSCGLISDWNVKEYTEKIKILLRDHELYKVMSENCLKNITNFSSKSAVDSFDAMIDNLPKKNNKNINIIKKTDAAKKLKTIYMFNIQFITIPIRIIINRFTIDKKIIDFVRIPYNLMKIVIYILTTPIRMVNNKFTNGF